MRRIISRKNVGGICIYCIILISSELIIKPDTEYYLLFLKISKTITGNCRLLNNTMNE